MAPQTPTERPTRSPVVAPVFLVPTRASVEETSTEVSVAPTLVAPTSQSVTAVPTTNTDIQPNVHAMQTALAVAAAKALAKATPNVDHDVPLSVGDSLNESSIEIHNVSVDYDVFDQSQKGMLIHIEVSGIGYLNQKLNMGAYFHYANGDRLVSSDKQYMDSAGNVAVFKDFMPTHYKWKYDNFVLFVPYRAFNIDGQTEIVVDLEFTAQVYDYSVKKSIDGANYSVEMTYRHKPS